MSPPDASGARDATGSTASASSGVMQCGAAWRAITRGAGTWRPAGPRRTAGAWLGVITSAPKVCATSRANAICICSSARPPRLWLRRRGRTSAAASRRHLEERDDYPPIDDSGFWVRTFEQDTQEGHTGIEELQDIEEGRGQHVASSRQIDMHAERLAQLPWTRIDFWVSACVGRSSICGRRQAGWPSAS